MPDVPKGFHDATLYLQMEPTWSRYGPRDRASNLVGVRATGLTQKPSARRGICEVKLTIRIPDGVFLPLRPEAVVVIPESMILTNAVEVEAVDPVD